MNAQHTPGPWYYKPSLTQMASPDTTVAMIGSRHPRHPPSWIFSKADEHGDHDADSRLIAAAPDLLAALDEAYAELAADGTRDGPRCLLLTTIEAALRKATGSQP